MEKFVLRYTKERNRSIIRRYDLLSNQTASINRYQDSNHENGMQIGCEWSAVLKMEV